MPRPSRAARLWLGQALGPKSIQLQGALGAPQETLAVCREGGGCWGETESSPMGADGKNTKLGKEGDHAAPKNKLQANQAASELKNNRAVRHRQGDESELGISGDHVPVII